MVQTYKIVRDIDIVDKDKLFTFVTDTRTTGHKYKLFKRRSRLNVCKNVFSNRVADTWNNLPDSACVRDSSNGTIGNSTNGTLVANGTIGNQRTLNSERFSAANGTIGANVTIGGNVGTNGTIGSPNGTICKLNGVNSNIMINTSNLFYVYILVFLLLANITLIKTVLICEIYKFKV